MKPTIDQLTSFLLELDMLKSVDRKSTITSGERRENSAEHSWHLAMAVWVFSEYLEKDSYDVLKLTQMALVHDLGEIHAGDTFLFSEQRADAAKKERQSLLKTLSHPGNPIPNLVKVWDEQETGTSAETALLKALDRLLPFLLNLANQGGTWREFGIVRAQVSQSQQAMLKVSPSIHQWIEAKIEMAVQKGWLKSS